MARLRRASPTPSARESSIFDSHPTGPPKPQSRRRRSGTAALSPSPSAASDKENLLVTPDTGFTKQSRVRGNMEPPPLPREDRGNKRRRLSERPSENISVASSQASDEETGTVRGDDESHYTIPDLKWFNPEQDEDERRHVRHRMRENIRDFNDHRDEMLADNGEKLIMSVKKSNKLMNQVRQTGDATIDSRFLVSASELAVKKAKVDEDTSAGVDIDEFVSRCIRFMRNGGLAGSQNVEEDGSEAPRTTQARREHQNRRSLRPADSDEEAEEEVGDALPWHVFGAKACFQCNRRPPIPNFLLGPLSVQKLVRQATQRTQRRTQNAASQQISRPQELRGEDLQTNDNTNLTILVTKIYARLKKVHSDAMQTLNDASTANPDVSDDELEALCRKMHIRRAKDDGDLGVPLFEFIINPWNFGQSVENCFYVSFLIKEGKATLAFDVDGLPILRYVSSVPSLEERRDADVKRRQAVISLDHGYWEQLIEAFDISEPLIPHREEEDQQVSHTGWYG